MKDKTATLDLFHDIESSKPDIKATFLDIESEIQYSETDSTEVISDPFDDEPDTLETDTELQEPDPENLYEEEQDDDEPDAFEAEDQEYDDPDTLDIEELQDEDSIPFPKNSLPVVSFPQLTGMMLPMWLFSPIIPFGIPIMAFIPVVIYPGN